ncbi:MAG: hypothetical protein ABJA80_11515 [bacterium]
MLHPYIEWTDDIGAARLTCYALTLQNWTPDQWEQGETEYAVGSGLPYFFSYRVDHVASFEFPNIANTELKLAMRLKSWLVRAGTCTIYTQDSESHVYLVCLAPSADNGKATPPALTFSDNVELEYMLALTVKNVDTPTPRPMPYTPVAHPRAASLTLSPSPLSVTVGGADATVTATVLDADGGAVSGVAVSMTSDDPGAFTVSGGGVSDGSGHVVFTVHPVAGGTGALHASGGGLTATDVVSVLAGTYGIMSPDPILWLKASTENAHADGVDVLTWHDSSPHGWDMTTKTGGSLTPKWDATKQAIRFNSSGPEAYENLSFNSLYNSGSGVTGFTLFIVAQEASNGGTIMSASDYTFWEGYTTAGRYRMDLGGFGYNAYFSYADLLEHLHETRYDGTQGTNAAKLKQLMDGTLESSTYYSMPSSLTSGPGMEVGHGQGLGNLNGWIWEVLMFGVRLSDAQCDSVRAQLMTKYGL